MYKNVYVFLFRVDMFAKMIKKPNNILQGEELGQRKISINLAQVAILFNLATLEEKDDPMIN